MVLLAVVCHNKLELESMVLISQVKSSSAMMRPTNLVTDQVIQMIQAGDVLRRVVLVS